jgi:protease IV
MLELLQYRSWCISEEFYNTVVPTLSKWLATGHSIDMFVNKKTMAEHVAAIQGLLQNNDDIDGGTLKMSASFDSATGLPVITAGNFSIAVIPMVGVLTKYGGACAYGMQDYQSMLSRAIASEKIDAILIKADSPGGTTDGTQELATVVRDSPKLIGTFIDGLNCSAMYWISSQGKGPMIANKFNTNTIGSIGTYGLYENISGKLEKEGITAKIIRAKQSTKKIAINPLEPLTPEGETEMVENATAINSVFISYVQSARPNVDKSVFDAGVYGSNKAKQSGLIDGVGTMQTAVNKMIEQIRKEKSQGTSGRKPNANTEMKFTKLSALLGAAWASLFHSGSEANTSLSPEQIASLEASEKKLSDSEALNAQMKADNEAHIKKMGELEQTVSEQAAQITALEGERKTLTEENAKQKAELEKKATGTATTVIPGIGEEGQAADQGATTEKNKFHTSVDDEVAKYESLSKRK